VQTIIADLRSASALVSETQDIRSDWGERFYSLDEVGLQSSISILEPAVRALTEIAEDWQRQLLKLVISDRSQVDFWREFYQKCMAARDRAFQSFGRIQGFQIDGLSQLDPEIDWLDPLDELARLIQKGRNPGSFLVKLLLSKKAKVLYENV
jgi:hypothetical protein